MKNTITFLRKAWCHTWNATKKTAIYIKTVWQEYYIGEILWFTVKLIGVILLIGILIFKWLLDTKHKD